MNKLFLSFIFSVILVLSIIFLIENCWSLVGFIIGLIMFFSLTVFLSSFKNIMGVFVITTITFLFYYFTIKHEYMGAILGSLNGLIIGGGLYYYKTSKAAVIDKKDIRKH